VSQPLPAQIILPTGQTGYLNPYSGTYTPSRAYGLRMQRAFSRGLGQGTARGHRIGPTGLTESQRRYQQSVAATGQTPWQRYTLNFERTYGFSYNYWRQLWRKWIKEINSRVDASVAVTPQWVQQEMVNIDFYAAGGLAGKPWIEQRLDAKLASIIAYQDDNDKSLGFGYYINRDGMRPIEWWYYH
jgi:CubicO group peptidase (beta-lactamase class C family)